MWKISLIVSFVEVDSFFRHFLPTTALLRAVTGSGGETICNDQTLKSPYTACFTALFYAQSVGIGSLFPTNFCHFRGYRHNPLLFTGQFAKFAKIVSG
jgi:hypothetical protein